MSADEVRKRILSFVYRASLPAEDVSLWEKVVTHIPNVLLSVDMLRFFEMEPNAVGFITENLKKKMQYFKTGDEKILDEAIADAKQFLLKPF